MIWLYIIIQYILLTLTVGMVFYERIVILVFKNKFWSVLFGIIYWYVAIFILTVSLFKLLFNNKNRAIKRINRKYIEIEKALEQVQKQEESLECRDYRRMD